MTSVNIRAATARRALVIKGKGSRIGSTGGGTSDSRRSDLKARSRSRSNNMSIDGGGNRIYCTYHTSLTQRWNRSLGPSLALCHQLDMLSLRESSIRQPRIVLCARWRWTSIVPRYARTVSEAGQYGIEDWIWVNVGRSRQVEDLLFAVHARTGATCATAEAAFARGFLVAAPGVVVVAATIIVDVLIVVPECGFIAIVVLVGLCI
ncbi:hypothetical protein BD289DRAFT_429302 [Coniella lustricola]|uniref:Uncharacterized protein n=1 Tax=Coniella lustricola TaxID=2025994 RepID=A0A2T3AD33_9PEZI|nr:hypothetical protein BD289DRAFT_429302 [Coniella lustricola]